MSDRRILITGSAGFIFSNFIRKVIYGQKDKEKQDTFISVDRVANNTLNNMYWGKNHTFYPADVRDEHVMNVIFDFHKPDIVIHGAAETFVDTSIKDPNSFITSNVLGTQVIINCCVKYGVKKLIYISTDEVYGQLSNDQAQPWAEDAPLNPRNPYSASKAAGELLVKAAHYTHETTFNITRSSNNYGPRQLPEKLLPKAIQCILENKPIPIYGQGLQIRDWTYVADNCAAILTIMDKGEPNQIYNISANQEFTNLETIQLLCNTMEKGHSLMKFVEDRPGHDFRYALDTTKLRSLGWKPEYKFKEGLAKTCEWFLANQWWFR